MVCRNLIRESLIFYNIINVKRTVPLTSLGIINKYNVSVAGIRVTEEDSGIIGVLNKNNEVIGTLP